ncbi:conserved uncharacterized protein [Erwinia billingiae Eb661]|uniref:Conserved uncharacterized protein n=1 Tax=Erwinia billingiae (strain Eb661) TaxID=634500 RepID=D8MP62_ERWBE|nr:hypothetical protein [Erwinia billingiae]CAX58619.1 conserved uncharacterized protein [Erwinia billingiae Eb661]
MSLYTFIGTIHPNRAIIDKHYFKTKSSFQTAGNVNEVFKVDVRILMNQLLVYVEGEDVFDMFTMRNFVQGIVEQDLAKVAFITGHSYRAEVMRVINDSLAWDEVYGINNTLITQHFPINDYDASLARIRKYSIGESGMYISQALSSMSDALKDVSDTSFCCYRALEWLKNHNALRLGKPKQKSWDLFKETLGLEADFIREKVGKLQLDARHGRPEILSEQQYKDCIKATWDIFHKYLDVIETK